MSIEFVCDVGKVHIKCNCHLKSFQQEAHYLALTWKVAVYAQGQQLAVNLILVKQMFFVREVTVIPSFLEKNNQVL